MPQATPTKAKSSQKTENQKYCSSCGKLINKEAEICPKCGVRQHTPQAQVRLTSKKQKNKVTAGLLALFLGGIGVHKFYLGSIGIGIVYIIFAWTLIPAFIAFIEAIIYLTYSGSDQEFTAKYAH